MVHVYYVLMYLNGTDNFAMSERGWKTTLEREDPAHQLYTKKYGICAFYFSDRLSIDDPNAGGETPHGQRNSW